MAPDDGAGGGTGGGETGGGGSTETGTGGGETQGGASGGDWLTSLPDDLKGEASVARHKTLEDFARAALAAERRLGVPADQLLRFPTKPEDLPAFQADVFKRLGAPEDPSGYKIEWDGMDDADKAMAGDFAKFMFEKGGAPPPAIVSAAVEFWRGKVAELDAAETQAAKEASDKALVELKGEYGAKFDQYSKDIGLMLANKDLGGGEALVQELDLNNAIGSNPNLFRFLAKLSDKLVESGAGPTGQARTGEQAMTPAEARAARAALESDPVKSKALRDGAHPMHQAVLEERNKYFRFENPSLYQKA
jgi:hypothetical protein